MSEYSCGILTIHQTVNYGATLQAFSTDRFLNQHGVSAVVVDYRQPTHEETSTPCKALVASWRKDNDRSLVHRLKLAAALLITFPDKVRKYRRFDRFRAKNMHLSAPCRDAAGICALGLNQLVCGSDQIWNPALNGGMDPIYFGALPYPHRTIAYAASMGSNEYCREDLECAVAWISAMSACGVREAAMKDYLSQYVSRPLTQVLDPVFLPEKQDFLSVMSKRRQFGKPYLLLYSVVHNEKMQHYAQRLSEEKGLVLLEICSSRTFGAGHRQITNAGPEEFLRLLFDADYVVTNSFHGTAFSLLFEKQFIVVNNAQRGSRIVDLLSVAGLSDRMIADDALPSERIDYRNVKQRLAQEQLRSREFLLRALEE